MNEFALILLAVSISFNSILYFMYLKYKQKSLKLSSDIGYRYKQINIKNEYIKGLEDQISRCNSREDTLINKIEMIQEILDGKRFKVNFKEESNAEDKNS